MKFVEPKVEFLSIKINNVVFASGCTDGSSGGANTCVNTGWGTAADCSQDMSMPGWEN